MALVESLVSLGLHHPLWLVHGVGGAVGRSGDTTSVGTVVVDGR